MKLTSSSNKLKRVFTSLSAIFALVPGLAVLLTNLGVPDPQMKTLFGAVTEAMGCLALALVFINEKYFKKIKVNVLNSIIITFAIVFFVFLLAYIFLFNYCVIDHTLYGRIYFPLYDTPGLHKKVAEAGGKYAFVEKYLGDGSRMIISRTARGALIITTIIFLVVYQAALTSLVIGFGIAGLNIPQLSAASSGQRNNERSTS